MKSIKHFHLILKEVIQKKGAVQKREAAQKKEEPKTVVFIAYFCLVCAVILFIGEAGDFSYNRLLVLGSILLLACILWPVNIKRRWRAALFLLFAYAFCFCLLKRPLDEQLNVLLYCLMNQRAGSGDFTLLFLALSLLVSLFCLFLVPILNKGWMVYHFTMFVLLMGPLFGYRPSGAVLGLLAAFHIGNSVYCTVYQKWSDETEEKNTRAAVLRKSFAAGLLLVFGALLLARMVPEETRKSWMKETVRLAQFLPQGMKSPLNYSMSYGESGERQAQVRVSNSAVRASGKISRGNHYSSGLLQLELTLSQAPEERMYLKDFTGGDYQGDVWAEADEADFYAAVNAAQEAASSYLSPEYFERRQFEMIRYGKRELGMRGSENPGAFSAAEPESQKLEVHPANGAQNSIFSPYLSSCISRDSRGVSFFDLFSWNEYYQYREKLGEKPLQWFAQMEEPYRAYAAEHYLFVPEERLPRLLALCRQHPLEDPKEITLWIRRTLADSAVYSQVPGFMPYGADIAEYFLFDGKEGYCQHFATAAVLMYRMQGIPARYVTGYAADPEDFSLGEDGQYHAHLTDEKAHAWAEIYLGGPGWLPVEVTPPGGGLGDSYRAGESVKAEDGLQSQQDWMMSFIQEDPGEGQGEEGGMDPAGEETGEEGSEEDGEQTGEPSVESSDEDFQEDVQAADEEEELKDSQKEGAASILAAVGTFLGIIGIAAVLFLAFAGAGWAKRKQRAKRLRQLGADELYQKMVALLHLGGYGKGFDGTEPEFCQAVIAQMEKEGEPKAGRNALARAENSGLTLKELEEIRGYAFQTAYGRKVSSDKEREKVQEGYEKMAAELAGRLRGIRKIKWHIMEAVLVWEK